MMCKFYQNKTKTTPHPHPGIAPCSLPGRLVETCAHRCQAPGLNPFQHFLLQTRRATAQRATLKGTEEMGLGDSTLPDASQPVGGHGRCQIRIQRPFTMHSVDHNAVAIKTNQRTPLASPLHSPCLNEGARLCPPSPPTPTPLNTLSCAGRTFPPGHSHRPMASAQRPRLSLTENYAICGQ